VWGHSVIFLFFLIRFVRKLRFKFIRSAFKIPLATERLVYPDKAGVENFSCSEVSFTWFEVVISLALDEFRAGDFDFAY